MKKAELYLTLAEQRKFKAALITGVEIYSKGDDKARQIAQNILDGWGRILFIVSNDGKRIGLELTERWERETAAES